MNYIFDPRNIRGNEITFYIYIGIICIIILIALFLVIKSVRNRKNVSK